MYSIQDQILGGFYVVRHTQTLSGIAIQIFPHNFLAIFPNLAVNLKSSTKKADKSINFKENRSAKDLHTLM